MDRRRSVVINGKTTFSQRSDSNSLLHQHLQRRCMAEESRGTGACTVSASKEDSDDVAGSGFGKRSEEHTSLQSLMRTSYDVFCLKQTKRHNNSQTYKHTTAKIKTTPS